MPGVAGRDPGPWGLGTCGGGGGWLVLGLRTAVKRSSTSLPSSSVKQCDSSMSCALMSIKVGTRISCNCQLSEFIPPVCYRYVDAKNLFKKKIILKVGLVQKN